MCILETWEQHCRCTHATHAHTYTHTRARTPDMGQWRDAVLNPCRAHKCYLYDIHTHMGALYKHIHATPTKPTSPHLDAPTHPNQHNMHT